MDFGRSLVEVQVLQQPRVGIKSVYREQLYQSPRCERSRVYQQRICGCITRQNGQFRRGFCIDFGVEMWSLAIPVTITSRDSGYS
jgi:hypothetical protein